ncbi:MAG: DUF6607 family protein [Verrucomicrobiota bacterium]
MSALLTPSRMFFLSLWASFAFLLFPGATLRAGPPAEDREAILAMAGEFEVLFNFQETVSLQDGYRLKEPYQESATEMVVVVEDSPGRIVLQHLLQTTKRKVVKHWKQVWTWEDDKIIEFQGREQWVVRSLTSEEAEGTWSQLVTQVDDSPRYESFGRWQHDGGYSRWESKPTARPLPRREHTKRDDYQILLAVNRHAITPYGWSHEQDNVKQVVGEAGEVLGYIAREHGVNEYDRITDTDFGPAKDYWAKTQGFWGEVSQFWLEVEEAGQPFGIVNEVGGTSLMKTMNEMAKSILEESGPAPGTEEVRAAIQSFLP